MQLIWVAKKNMKQNKETKGKKYTGKAIMNALIIDKIK